MLKIKKGQELTTFTIRKDDKYVPAKVSKETDIELKKSKIKDNTIGEFIYNTKTKEFELLGLRKDKETPNALSTAINVMNAIKHPVDLEIIKKFFLVNKLNQTGLKQLLEYMSKNQMLRCMVNNNKIELFNNL